MGGERLPRPAGRQVPAGRAGPSGLVPRVEPAVGSAAPGVVAVAALLHRRGIAGHGVRDDDAVVEVECHPALAADGHGGVGPSVPGVDDRCSAGGREEQQAGERAHAAKHGTSPAMLTSIQGGLLMGSMLPRLFASALLAAALPAAGAAQDAGRAQPGGPREGLPEASRRTRPTRAGTTRRGPSSATRTCTRRSRSTRAPSARGSRRATRTASRAARRSRSTRAAGEALAPARLPRRRRPLGRHGLLPADLRRATRRSWPTRRASKWHDMIASGQGADAAIDIIRELRHGDVPEGHLSRSRHARLQQRVAADDQGRGARRTTRAASPPSSATSGRRTPGATTCTAT